MPLPVDVEKVLGDVSFPADKQALVKEAKKKSADGEMISALNGISSREYISSDDVMMELGIGAESESM